MLQRLDRSIKAILVGVVAIVTPRPDAAIADQKAPLIMERVTIQSVLCDSGHYIGWGREVTQEELKKTPCDAPEKIRGLEILIRRMGERKVKRVRTDKFGNLSVSLLLGRYDVVASSLEATFCANGSYFHPLLADKVPNGCRSYTIGSFGNIFSTQISEFWSKLGGRGYEFVVGMTITVRKNASNTFRMKFYQPVSNAT